MSDPDDVERRRQSSRSVLAAFASPVAIITILFAPLIGSFSSAIIFAVAIIGLAGILLEGRLPDVPRPVGWTAAAFATFFGAELLAGIVNWNGSATAGEIGANIAFLGVLPAYALIVLPRERLLGGLLMATPWCAFAALTFAAFQQFILGYRPQGGDGNAGVFAVTSAIVLAFALANVLDAKRPRNTVLALGGLFAAAATLILSETRALWPCLAIFPVVLWLTTQRHGESGPRRRIAALATLVIVAAALLFAATIYKRTEQAGADIAAAEMGKNATSLGKRLVIWKVAIGAIAERPLLGHGIDSPRRIMDARTAKVGGTTIAYSHFHNFVLDEMVRAGLVGTIALIAMLAVPFFAAASHVRDRTASIGFGLLICVQTAFLLSGSVNIMLHHDIMDAQFLANTVLCLYFVFGRRGETEEADAEPLPGAGAVTEASHLQEDRK